jgi:hypothetical protein
MSNSSGYGVLPRPPMPPPVSTLVAEPHGATSEPPATVWSRLADGGATTLLLSRLISLCSAPLSLWMAPDGSVHRSRRGRAGFRFYIHIWMKSERGSRSWTPPYQGVSCTRDAREVGDDNRAPCVSDRARVKSGPRACQRGEEIVGQIGFLRPS